MSDYGDSDDEYLGVDDLFETSYQYIEEAYALADDLAERTAPSPPPADTDDSAYLDFDRFDYWYDADEADDGYCDYYPQESALSGPQAAVRSTSGDAQKRKRGDAPAGSGSSSSKRQKLGSGGSRRGASPQPPAVLWRSRAARDDLRRPDARTAVSGRAGGLALLGDWRERFAAGTSTTATATTTAEEGDRDEDEEMQDRAGDNAEGEQPGVPQPSAAAIRAVLARRLADSGLEALGADVLLQSALRMLDDAGAGDDVAGELAREMLGGVPLDAGDVDVLDGVDEAGEEGDEEEGEEEEGGEEEEEAEAEARSGPGEPRVRPNGLPPARKRKWPSAADALAEEERMSPTKAARTEKPPGR